MSLVQSCCKLNEPFICFRTIPSLSHGRDISARNLLTYCIILTIGIVAAEESCGIKRSYQELYLQRELVPLLAFDIELIDCTANLELHAA